MKRPALKRLTDNFALNLNSLYAALPDAAFDEQLRLRHYLQTIASRSVPRLRRMKGWRRWWGLSTRRLAERARIGCFTYKMDNLLCI